MSMTAQQRTKQMQAIHIDYSRKVSDGVLQQINPDVHEGCHVWATLTLGRLISTLKACTDFELNALRDTLNGKPPKIHARLRDVLTRTKKNPDQWINWMMHHAPAFKRYADENTTYTVETIPLIEAYRLLRQQLCRHGEAQPQTTQQTDWGM